MDLLWKESKLCILKRFNSLKYKALRVRVDSGVESQTEREGDGAAQSAVGHDELLRERQFSDAAQVEQEC